MKRLKLISGNFFKDENFRISTETGRLKFFTNDFIMDLNLRTKVGSNKTKLVPYRFEDQVNLT